MVVSAQLFAVVVVCTLAHAAPPPPDALRFEPICRPADDGRFVRFDAVTDVHLWQCTGARAERLSCSSTFPHYFGLCAGAADYAQEQQSPPPQPAFSCPPDGLLQFAMAGTCSRFHFCMDGRHAVHECAPDMHFDAVRGGCNFAHLANCRRDLCPEHSAPGAPPVSLPSNSSCGE